MTTKDRIQKWLHKVGERDSIMEQEDACFLMIQVRHLIEESANPNQYQLAKFYGDWVAHTKLDKSKMGGEILRDITKVFSENWGITKKDITIEISNVIGLSILRSQLIEVFNANGLPVQIFDIPENWRNVAGLIGSFLIDKPILFPKNNEISRHASLHKIHKQMMAIQKPANFWVESLKIVEDKEGYPHWYVQLGGDKSVSIMGILS